MIVSNSANVSTRKDWIQELNISVHVCFLSTNGGEVKVQMMYTSDHYGRL